MLITLNFKMELHSILSHPHALASSPGTIPPIAGFNINTEKQRFACPLHLGRLLNYLMFLPTIFAGEISSSAPRLPGTAPLTTSACLSLSTRSTLSLRIVTRLLPILPACLPLGKTRAGVEQFPMEPCCLCDLDPAKRAHALLSQRTRWP
jgi:hypothetical protein